MKPQHCATPCDCCTCTHAPLLPPPCPLHLAPPPRLPRRAPTAHLRVQHFPPPPPSPPPALRPSPPRAARFTKATSRLTRRAFTSSPPSPHRICLARLVQHPTPRPSSTHECITAFRCTRARRARRTSHPTTSRIPCRASSNPAPSLCILFALLTRSCNTIPAGTSSAWRPRCRPSPRALRGSDAAATLVQRARPAADQASTGRTRRSSCETVGQPAFAPACASRCRVSRR